MLLGLLTSTSASQEKKNALDVFLPLLTYVFIFSFLFCIEVQLIYNVVIVSDEQQRDSATHIHGSILPQTPLPPGPAHLCKQVAAVSVTPGSNYDHRGLPSAGRGLSQSPWEAASPSRLDLAYSPCKHAIQG